MTMPQSEAKDKKGGKFHVKHRERNRVPVGKIGQHNPVALTGPLVGEEFGVDVEPEDVRKHDDGIHFPGWRGLGIRDIGLEPV